MIELLRNCSHGSETALYLVHQTAMKVRKAASTPAGIAELRCELDGWEWYGSRRYSKGRSFPYITIERASYLRIERDWIEGTKGDYTKGIIHNADRLHSAITHYLALWPRQKDNVPIHGDFSIDNLLLNAEGMHVIDWEHFDLQGGPWGFDALYLLFETLWFSVKNERPINNAEGRVIRPLMEQMKSRGLLSEGFCRQPLSSVREFLRTRPSPSGTPLFESKFPVFRFSSDQVNVIDQTLRPLLETGA